MNVDFCVKCGKKTFEQSFCSKKWKCRCCGYFLVDAEFQEIKREAEKRGKVQDGIY